MARPKKSEERDTRQGILDAALDLFAERGFFGTSMRDIAKVVGVRESALYHHFESKDAIMEGLVATYGPGQIAQFGQIDFEALIEATGPKQMLEQLVQLILAVWNTPREQKFMRLIMSEGVRLGERDVLSLPAVMKNARTQLSRLFEVLIKKKVIKRHDPYALTLEFVAPLMMLRIMYLVVPKGPPDLKALNAEVAKHLDFFWQAAT